MEKEGKGGERKREKRIIEVLNMIKVCSCMCGGVTIKPLNCTISHMLIKSMTSIFVYGQ
jgi:hypothetical protein